MTWRRFCVLLSGLSVHSLWVLSAHIESQPGDVATPQNKSNVIEGAAEAEAAVSALLGV